MNEGSMQTDTFGFMRLAEKKRSVRFQEGHPGNPAESHIVSKGDILVYPRELVHAERRVDDNPITITCMNFMWPDRPEDMPIKLSDERGRIQVLLDWLTGERESLNPMTQNLCDALLHALVSQTARLWLYRDDLLLRTVRRHVIRNIAEPITLEDLATEAGMSKHHFLRRFKDATGRTPIESVRRIRLEYARELILTTARPLKEIAERVGFSDAQHLSRLFKKYYKITPGHLRR